MKNYAKITDTKREAAGEYLFCGCSSELSDPQQTGQGQGETERQMKGGFVQGETGRDKGEKKQM